MRWLNTASERDSRHRQIRSLLYSDRARPLRFVMTGGISGCLQLVALYLGTRWGLHPLPANAAAFFIAAQLNFYLSQTFTWHDRRHPRFTAAAMLRRWLAFHLSIMGAAVLNLAIFALARLELPQTLAAICGIGGASVVNFLVHNRLAFRHHPRRVHLSDSVEPASHRRSA